MDHPRSRPLDPRDRRLARARLLVLVWLATTLWTSLLMPGIGLTRETRPVWVVLGAVGILAFSVTTAGAVRSAVTPWLGERARRRWLVASAVTTVASLGLVAPVAAGVWDTWAWIGATVVGVSPLLVRARTAVVVGLGCTAVSAATAWVTGGAVWHAVVITGLIGASVAAVNWSPVWLWSLLVDAGAAREARAQLAASEERLRFARDVHDLLGHDLTVIALKAELVARLEPGDPQVRTEAEQIRQIASSALGEVREAVHGYRSIDLVAQLDAVRTVLGSADVRCTVDGDLTLVPPGAATTLVPVLREAATNVLRHSEATWCRVEVGVGDGTVTLAVRNDGVRGAPVDPFSSGLAGVADRLAEAGGALSVDRDGDEFVLRARVPGLPAPSTTGGPP